MKNPISRALFAATLLASMSACTWVKLSEEAEAVTVATAAPAGCKKLGSTRSMTKADIASIDRKRGKVGTELETLARNAAAKMGGDTVVPETDISDAGEQTFGVYRCSM